VAKLFWYLLLAFVALDEPSNLPRLAISHVFNADASLLEAATDVTELDRRAGAPAPVAQHGMLALDYRILLPRCQAPCLADAVTCSTWGKGCARLLRC
jgi:hypothetical protein